MLSRALRYLLAVADHGSFTRAAQALHVSQPALSQQIKLLEDRLGKPLLDRGAKSVRPTDIGQVYIAHTRRALAEMEAAERRLGDVENLSSGTLRLGYAPSFEAYLIGPLLQRFHHLHPGVQVQLRQLSQERIESDLKEARLDVGLGFDRAELEDIEGLHLHDEQMSLIMGVRSGASRQRCAPSPPDLATIPLILLDGSFATRIAIDSHFLAHQLRPTVAIEASSITPILDLLRLSDLATILPSQIGTTQPGLQIAPLVPPMKPRKVMLLRRAKGYRSYAEQAFHAVALAVSLDLSQPGAT